MTSETNEFNVFSDKQENGRVIKDTVDINIDTNEIKNTVQIKMEEEESVLQPSPDSTSQLSVSNNQASVTNNVNSKQQTRVVPFVFVQAQSNLKVPTSMVSVANTISNQQIIVNANSQFINTLSNKLNMSKSATPMTSVVIPQTTATNKPQQIILQKTANNPGQTLIPVSVATSTGTKQTFAYLGAIIKPPNGKPGENQIVVPTNHLPAGLVPAPTNQKLVLTPMTMPKLSSRLPVTCSTTSINHPKIANIILPMSLSSPINKNNNQSVINFKISNGQIQSDPKGSIKVLCENKKNENDTVVTSTTIEKKEEKILGGVTEVVINTSIANNPPRSFTGKKAQKKLITNPDKQYELSIPEEPAKCDLNYTIKLSDDMKTYKIEKNGEEVNSIKTELPDKCPISNSTPSVIVHPKQEHRKPLHEVSILKKCNLNSNERKTETGKNKLLTRKSPEKVSEKTENKVTTTQEVRKVSTERRRKSQYTYLRDFDEIVVTSGNAWQDKEKSNIEKYSKQFQSTGITFTKLNSPDDEAITSESDTKKSVDDFVEIEVVKQDVPQFSSDDVTDIRTALEWKDGIGFLPGSKLKFHLNQYGFIQMLFGDEFSKIEIKTEEDQPANQILNCSECGCYGMPSEFISKNYCSATCKTNALSTYEKLKKDAFLKESKSKKKKKKLGIKTEIKSEIKTEDLLNSDEDVSVDGQDQSKINYPWQGGKKGFSWAKYLDHVKAKAAPIKLFKDPFPYAKNGFRVGMKLEGIDPQHPSYYCVLTVAEVQGYRIRLHFDGYSDSYDFWANADSMDIFPCGWCEKYSHTLHPPPGYSVRDFNWNSYLKICKATSAPRHLFSNRAGNSMCPNGFRLGMKLEAVDKKNTSLVCVATVTDQMDNRFLVHFDSWDDIYDYWADPSSPYIHPVGWCDKYGHNLTPPNDYTDPGSFTWEKYLKHTKSTAAPVRAFKQRPATGFKCEMRIECVDRRVPQLIRVATVDDIKEHQIRIRFDGWPQKYSYWVDDDSPDIHPPGWCQKTGHQLESPLTPEDVYENFDECPTVGCRGVGHILGAIYETHNNAKDCPYSDENLDDPPMIPDRLHLLEVKQEAVPISREPRKDSKPDVMCKPAKIRRLTETESKPEWPTEEDSSDSTRKRKISTREPSPASSDNKLTIAEDINRFKSIVSNTEYTNPSQQALVKHTKYLNEIIGYNSKDPKLWTEEEVTEFVNSLPSCRDHSKLFTKEKIDGEAFLMLTQKDLVDILKFKLGPAIKLYNSILLLRQNVNLYN